MNGWTKEATVKIINNNITNIHNSYKEFLNTADAIQKETLEFFEGLLEQIPNAISGPLIPKTPKLGKKRDLKRIQTIPENDVVVDVDDDDDDDDDNDDDDTKKSSVTTAEQTYDEIPSTRIRRAASQKAAQNIKVQQSVGLGAKLRRPSVDEEAVVATSQTKPSRSNRAKRTKSVAESSDDEDTVRPAKFSKIKRKFVNNENQPNEEIIKNVVAPDATFALPNSSKNRALASESKERESRNKRRREKSDETNISRPASRCSGKILQQPLAKRANFVTPSENTEITENDTTVEASLYEDAIGKTIPMNSTMNPNTSVTFDRKMMNVTVVLEAMKFPRKINETVTIERRANDQSSDDQNATLVNETPPKIVERIIPDSPRGAASSVLQSKMKLQNVMKALKGTLANPEFDALITEDESSPEKHEEEKSKKYNRPKDVQVKEEKRFTRSSLLSEEDDYLEVTPPRPKAVLRDLNNLKLIKGSYKPNPLFSPYSKESVKKRVEAFEQVGLNSPKTVEIDAPARLTRTKTRAMTAAAAETNFTQTGQSIAQIAARKSLSRAKEIAKMKERKENEDGKENNVVNSAQKTSRLLGTNEKLTLKQQQRTTPLGKNRLQMPMSVNRIQHTPAGSQIANQNKALTASKTNIVTSVDSFIQPPKTLTKSNSNDNLAEKRRKIYDEDARRKREEALKALSEEKRRKREEKELKNKLAREAKEKLDMEKRLKQEKEREEKARAALLLQEKQREESERKKLIQLQRAQEKEERRRQEEKIRLCRLQEQDEVERQLAEQKRREQEAEKRKLAEVRAQLIAATEAARIKAHYIAKAKNASKQQQQQDPMSYILDSEPDDDESDDESRPKHVIPYWAQPSIRKPQLSIQQYIPMSVTLAFFGAKRCTPDLTDLFKGIKKERLQRTSSALWKTPPRYSMMTDE